MPNKSDSLKLTVIIHTEEEFDWSAGFLRSNTQVNHGAELIKTVDVILNAGAKVVLAMDYAFVSSEQGQQVINHYLNNKNIEFAAHCHPWVNPPFETANDVVENEFSYPGNLTKEMEYQKLNILSKAIEEKTAHKPTTYLAGRYGIGENTQEILSQLGFKTDVSISPYADFSHQQGPDFSGYSNKLFTEGGIKYWPHTTGIVSLFSWLTQWLNSHPKRYTALINNAVYKLFAKGLRIQRLRLSPEGFRLKHLKRLTQVLIKQGQRDFIFSFHSSTVKIGGSPYVQTEAEQKAFMTTIKQYLEWYKNELKGEFYLVNEVEAA